MPPKKISGSSWTQCRAETEQKSKHVVVVVIIIIIVIIKSMSISVNKARNESNKSMRPTLKW